MDIESREWEIMYTNDEIQKRLRELANSINEDYKDKNLLVVSLLKGSFIFCSDLVRYIKIPVKINFMTTSSYGTSTETSGKVRIVADLNMDITNYDVLIVDDITDTATTMSFVYSHLKERKPKSLKSCVLLDKPSRRRVEFKPDYIGFEIEDKFVVGYGFDYNDYYRNVPYIFNVL